MAEDRSFDIIGYPVGVGKLDAGDLAELATSATSLEVVVELAEP